MVGVYTTVFKPVHPPPPPDIFIMDVFNSVGEEGVHPLLARKPQVEEVGRALGLELVVGEGQKNIPISPGADVSCKINGITVLSIHE